MNEDRKILAAQMYHDDSMTLDEIGTVFGVSRERVRQWLSEIGRPSSQAKNSERQAAKRQATRDEIRADVVALYQNGHRASEIARIIGVSEQLAFEVLRDEFGDIRSYQRRVARRSGGTPGSPPVTNDDLLDRLREAASEIGSPMSALAFTEWARKRGHRMHQTYLFRWPNWRAALEAAGLPSNHSRGRQSNISQNDALDALVSVGRILGRPPTCSEYEDLRAADDPSVSTVRLRLGTWSRAIDLVHARLEREAS